jgi:hypothetical protein
MLRLPQRLRACRGGSEVRNMYRSRGERVLLTKTLTRWSVGVLSFLVRSEGLENFWTFWIANTMKVPGTFIGVV